MTLRNVALKYGEFLLRSIRLNGALGRWDAVADCCDRFERLMANLPPVPTPLLWDGDYA